MPANASKQTRANYKGQLTIAKRQIESYIADEVSQDDLVDLITLKENIDRIEAKYQTVQEKIILDADPDEEEQEVDELNCFLTDCADTANKASRLINAAKTNAQNATGDAAASALETSDLKTLVMNVSTHLEKQQAALVSLVEVHKSEMTKLGHSSRNSGPSPGSSIKNNIVSADSNVDLEPLKIPKFSGSYAQWKSFQDLFKSGVHFRSGLSNAQKLHYLKTSLSGEALRVVDHLAICDENYSVAWELLEEQYEDKLCIVNAHIDDFLGQAPITKATAQSIRKLQTMSSSILQALEALNVTERDPWLINMTLKKLDNETQMLWSQQVMGRLAKWGEFSKFLQGRYKSLETCASNQSKSQPSHDSKSTRAKCAVTNVNNLCKLCNKQEHKLYRCREFLKLPASSRVDTVHKLKICTNCLSESHSLNTCAYPSCRHCSQKHNRLLHDALANMSQDSGQVSQSDTPRPPQSTPPNFRPNQASNSNFERNPVALKASYEQAGSNSSASGSGVLLATAIVMIQDSDYNLQPCRALLDAGSQVNIMTTSLQQRLKLKSSPANFIVEGIGATPHKAKKHVHAYFQIQSDGENSLLSLDCLVMPAITGEQPIVTFDVSAINIPAHITLADPHWYRKGPIELLIGGQFFWSLVKGESIELGAGLPMLRESSLGWLIVGPHFSVFPQTMPITYATCGISTLESIDNSIKKFWEIEEVPQEDPPSLEAVEVETLFQSTTCRTDSGRYMVHLPFKENVDSLQSNRLSAVRQFYSLEARMNKTPELKAQYNEIIQEYLDLGIVEAVPYDELKFKSYYFPHHCVVKESAVSTKIRVVFNASSKSPSGLSLNDVLKIGPVVQPSLVAILWRFRMHPVALTCDIVKMYLQTMVHPPHRDFQRFIWRKSSEDKLMDMRFRTVCFGVASSPYLATRALNQLASDEGEKYKSAAQVIKNNFYVDDCLVSAPTERDIFQICEELVGILKLAGMELSKFNSNARFLLSDTSDPDVPIDDHTTKTLGMIWSPKADTFRFKVNLDSENDTVTKRRILSVIARIFDPLGLLGPLNTSAKLIMQQTWRVALDWDAEISDEYLDESSYPLRNRWLLFVKELKTIESMRIPRWISNIQFPTHLELHGFSDASGVAYGAAVYVVSEDSSGNRSASLMTSKSKLCPFKNGIRTLTIPKAELCAAVLVVKLVSSATASLDIHEVRFWVDATIVLHQVYAPLAKRELFVKNRITEILKLSVPEQWRHVPGKDNPADLISRGTTSSQLIDCSLWWNGPGWLERSQEFWPQPFDPSCAIVKSGLISSHKDPNKEKGGYLDVCEYLSMHFSKISKMKTILAKCMAISKFWVNLPKRNTRQRERLCLGPSVEQIRKAEVMMIRWYQMLHLESCFAAIQNNSIDSVTQLKSLRKLRPFIDSDGLLRVGGRLQLLNDGTDVKHPILLPKGTLANAIITEEHERMLHAGPMLLLSTIRQRYWPLNGRNATRWVVRNCVRCTRANPQIETQLMGSLPQHRISHIRAFKTVGVDFAGPLLIRKGVRRDSTDKAYVAVFVCMSVKAVHLELVSSLSTDAFLACLRRFIARRGIPSHIYSDNGRNFLGASSEIRRLFESDEFKERVSSNCTQLNIEWKFQPPKAPHHGGLWEAAVKSFKFHLKRIVGGVILNFEELTTILAQIEAVLNSRPLTPISENVEDLNVLTPGMFLIGESPCQLPEPNLTQENIGSLKRWRVLQKLTQDLSRRWKVEYLHTLQVRNKWSKVHKDIKCGDLVLIKDDLSPSTVWPMGRVIEVFPGLDGHIRVVMVKAVSGTYKRPISQIVKLPIESS